MYDPAGTNNLATAEKAHFNITLVAWEVYALAQANADSQQTIAQSTAKTTLN